MTIRYQELLKTTHHLDKEWKKVNKRKDQESLHKKIVIRKYREQKEKDAGEISKHRLKLAETIDKLARIEKIMKTKIMKTHEIHFAKKSTNEPIMKQSMHLKNQELTEYLMTRILHVVTAVGNSWIVPLKSTQNSSFVTTMVQLT